MTETQEPLEWKPRGHPVRWAIGLSAGVALLSSVSIWFGALSPRIGALPVRWGQAPSDEDDAVEIQVELTNQAHTDATVTGAGESVPGLAFEGMDLSSRQDGPPDGVDRIAGSGGHLWVTLRYRITDCAAIPLEPAAIPIRVRTALGLEITDTDLVDFGPFDGAANPAWTIQVTKWRCG